MTVSITQYFPTFLYSLVQWLKHSGKRYMYAMIFYLIITYLHQDSMYIHVQACLVVYRYMYVCTGMCGTMCMLHIMYMYTPSHCELCKHEFEFNPSELFVISTHTHTHTHTHLYLFLCTCNIIYTCT